MASLKQALLAIRSGGLRHSLEILRYTIQKSRLERTQPLQAVPMRIPPGRLYKLDIQNRNFIFRFEHAQLEIAFLAQDLVCLEWSPGYSIPPYAIERKIWPPTAVQINQAGQEVYLSSDCLQIRITELGEISFLCPTGAALRKDPPPNRLGNGWTSDIELQPDTVLLGLGIHSGPYNLLRRAHLFNNRDPGGRYGPLDDPLYMPIPVFLALQQKGSYLAFFENSARGIFAPKEEGDQKYPSISVQFESGRLRHYFIAGTPAQALERYSELTGRAPLPPIWSLGYHQSRWGYRSAAELRQVVEGFRAHQLPLSAIHLDLDHLHDGRMFAFDPVRFPDPAGLCNWLAQAGVQLVTILDPGIKIDPGYDLYAQGVAGGHFCKLPDGQPVEGILWVGRCHYPDFTHPDSRRWWGDQYPRLLELGVRGFWHDMNEPVSFTAWGDLELPETSQFHLEGSKAGYASAHNLYGFQMNRSGYEALQRYRPDNRPWILSRSGWAGSQRFAWNWTADTGCTWECLRMNLASILSLGLSGFAYTGPDIGGFDGDPPAELYLRWFQMASFLPFFRTHSAIGTRPREPWVYGEPYTSIIRQQLNLRNELMPYLYSLSWEHTQTGAPLIRPLFWDHPADPELWEVDDAFLLGSALLVAPVLEPGAPSRSLRLPAGEWYDFWTGEHINVESSHQIDLPISLDRIPVLARAGSLLPRRHGEGLVLSLYPHATPSSHPLTNEMILYSDAGEGYGSHRLDRFKLRETAEEIVVDWTEEGQYPFPYSSVALSLPSKKSARLWMDGKPIPLIDSRALCGRFQQIKLTELHDMA